MADTGKAGAPPEPAVDEKEEEEEPFDFEKTFEDVKGNRCKVEKLAVLGLKRTKQQLVLRELLKVQGATTLDEIKDTLLDAYENLVGLDIFDAVEIVIDADERVSQQGLGLRDRVNKRAAGV